MKCSRCGAVIPENEGMCLACGSVVQKSKGEGLPPGTVIAGKYELVEQIGAGGMGRIYRALQRPLDTEVCVKTLHKGATSDPQFEARFEQEARTMSALRHPNIVSILDFGVHVDGSMYIVMEYIGGKSLADLSKGEKILSAARAVRILGQVCDALAAAHDKGVIHRDLKPANIMVFDLPEKPDYVKVLDFGSAILLESAEGEAERLTRVGTVIGTPAFMAPEHILGRGLDARVDVYAVGVLLYSLLAGSAPFRGKAQAVFAQQVSVQPELPTKRNPKADVSPAMERVIMKALVKDPAKRYRAAAELKGAMEGALAGTLEEDFEVDTGADAMGVEVAPEERALVVATVRGAYGLAEEVIDKVREVAGSYGAAVEVEKSSVAVLFGLDRKGPELMGDAIQCAMELSSLGTKRPVRVGVHDAQASCRGRAGEPGFSYEIFGEGRSLADSLASTAAPGQVLVSGPVARHVPGNLRLTPVLPPAHFSEPVFELSDPATEAGARRLPLVGREAEQRALVEVAVDAKGGQVCVLEGPEGIGKSRLVEEVASQASRLGTLWCVVRASARAEIGPSHPVSVVAALGWSSPATGSASTTERYIVDLMLGRPQRKLDGMSGERRQLRLVAASLEGLGKRLQHGPAVIVLDQLQHADDLTWALARRLVDTAHLLEVSVVLCVRERSQIPFALPVGTASVELGPLSDAEMRQLTAGALGGGTDEATVELVAAKAQGVPLLAEEIYRTVSRGEGSLLMALSSLSPMEAVERLVNARIETLSEAALEVLCAAAVLGAEPSQAELMEMTGESHEAMAALVELQTQALLQRSPGRRLEFPYPRVRDVALRAVPRAAVRELHAKVAKIISQSDWAENRRFEIGEHLLAAGEHEAAFDELRRAASLARGDGETRRAARCLELCVEAGAQLGDARVPERVAVARDYGELLTQLGRLEPAEKILRLAFAEAREGSVADVGADLLRLHGTVAVLTGDLARGRTEIEATLVFAEKHEVSLVAAKACGDLADIEERDGDPGAAAEALRRGLSLIEGRDDDEAGGVRIQLWNRLGRLELQAGKLKTAIALFAQALDLAEKLEDQYQAAGLLGNLGGAYARQQDSSKALHFTERALRASEALGDQIGVARQSFNLALLRLQSGQTTAAKQLLRGSHEAAKRSGWKEGIAMSTAAMQKLGESPR